MKYAVPAKMAPNNMACMCRQGCCLVKGGFFLCPFGCKWPDTASKCGRVTTEMWSSLLVEEPLNEEDEAEKDMIHYLARQGAVRNLISQLSEHDVINRMSMEGELKEIEVRLQELKDRFPKAMERLLKRA